eukprot:1646933-Pyramimonas_sp.AAC.1
MQKWEPAVNQGYRRELVELPRTMRARQSRMPRARGRGPMEEDWRRMRKRRRTKEEEQQEEKEGRIKKGI